MRPLIPRRNSVLPPRDPAPSIWSYRFQRIWLTPVFRAVLRVGLPAFLLVAGPGFYLSDPANWRGLTDRIAEIRREFGGRPEFLVTRLSIEGAGPELSGEIRQTIALDLPQSSFDIDLDRMLGQLAQIPAIARAELRLRPGGELDVMVQERVPAVIWHIREGIVFLDKDGHYIADLGARAVTGPLPMIAGEGANLAIDEALELYATAVPLGDQLFGLVRVGERRWDVVLHDGRRILLPSAEPGQAFDRVLALNTAQEILDRDILRVDVRDPARLNVQLSPAALAELRRVRGYNQGDGSE